jgi:hypothetical protein
MVFVEDPDKERQIKEEIGAHPTDELYGIPSSVVCGKCDAEFKTNFPENNPLEQLVAALEALEEADGDDDIAVPIGTIVDNAGLYATLLRELFDEMESIEDDDAT